MILVNTDYISGKELETICLVKGSAVQTRDIGRSYVQSFKSLVGGELTSYTELMNETRELATNRMIEEATALGADGIVNIRFSSSEVTTGAAEVVVYGTAVKFVAK